MILSRTFNATNFQNNINKMYGLFEFLVHVWKYYPILINRVCMDLYTSILLVSEKNSSKIKLYTVLCWTVVWVSIIQILVIRR